jgi:uncharacterized protein YwqG
MEAIETLQRLLARPACHMVVGGFRPPSDPFTSWFGRVCVAQEQELWPVFEGKPMIPLCQINCNELPLCPETLVGVGFLTLFIGAQGLPALDTANGQGWLLRTYTAGQPLNLLEQPASLESSVKTFPIRWELIEKDYPCWDDAVDYIADPTLLDVFEVNRMHFPRHYCSKIGGWPSLIQSELFTAFTNKPQYVFQVDSESKAHWGWGDGGIGYFGHVLEHGQFQWFLDWQQL